MGLRFRKSFKIAPGIRLNLSKSGVSASVGRKGAIINVSGRGVRGTVGIPGTGLSYQENITGTGGRSRKSNATGYVASENNAESLLGIAESLDAKVNQRMLKDIIEQQIVKGKVSSLNTDLKSVVDIHLQTLSPKIGYKKFAEPVYQSSLYTPEIFTEDPPVTIAQRVITAAVTSIILGMIWLWVSTIFPPRWPPNWDSINASGRLLLFAVIMIFYVLATITEVIVITWAVFSISGYKKARSKWESKKRLFEFYQQRNMENFHAEQKGLKEKHDAASKNFAEIMSNKRDHFEEILNTELSRIEWPRETLVSYDMKGDVLMLDVDLPRTEEIPEIEYTSTESGTSIKAMALSDTKQRTIYARHIHGIGFLLIGEAFRCLDFIEEVIVSGYSQFPDPTTGNLKEDYLYSVRVKRDVWSKINFDNLDNIDPIEALGAFEIRRDMSKTGVFKAIEPLTI
jgi:hypothetical protein